MVTRAPSPPKMCPISAAITPPPMTISDSGTSSMRMIVSDVWKSTSDSPSIAGTTGRVPLATTIVSAVIVSAADPDPTSITFRPTNRAAPV